MRKSHSKLSKNEPENIPENIVTLQITVLPNLKTESITIVDK